MGGVQSGRRRIDHEILQLHHVYQNGAHALWDIVFLISGLVLIAGGWALIHAGLSAAVEDTLPSSY